MLAIFKLLHWDNLLHSNRLLIFNTHVYLLCEERTCLTISDIHVAESYGFFRVFILLVITAAWNTEMEYVFLLI